MRFASTAFLLMLLAAACDSEKAAAPAAQRPGAATPPATPQSVAKPVPPATARSRPSAARAPQSSATVAAPGASVVAVAATAAPNSEVSTPPAASPLARGAQGTRAPHEPEVAAKLAPPPAAVPELDLKALKDQLRQTKAIGFLTKITLKNQVDDLLQRFREHYKGKATPTLKDLRRSYDLLMMKVLSLLQDEDQQLASAIVASREAIWGLLADPVKFETLQG